MRCGGIRKNEQGGCGKREINHIGFHVAALTKQDCGVRVIRTQKPVYANSAQSSSPLVPEIAQTFVGGYLVPAQDCPVQAAQGFSCESARNPSGIANFLLAGNFSEPDQHCIAIAARSSQLDVEQVVLG